MKSQYNGDRKTITGRESDGFHDCPGGIGCEHEQLQGLDLGLNEGGIDKGQSRLVIN